MCHSRLSTARLQVAAIARQGQEPTELELDFPSVYDGARGVKFIEKVVESSQSDKKWIEID